MEESCTSYSWGQSDCLEFPTSTVSEQALSSLSAFRSCNWPNSLWSFPYNKHTFFHHMTSIVLKMETVRPPKVSEHSITSLHKTPKEKYNLSVCYLFLHVSPLKFVTKNPNFEHQLIYEYLKNQWFACKSGSNTNYNHHIWYRSFTDSWTLGECR
jgi:hypothetical protein